MLPIVAVARSMARFGEGDYAGALETADLAMLSRPSFNLPGACAWLHWRCSGTTLLLPLQ